MDSSSIPFFSVLIPAYNAEKYIEKCLSSINSQTFTDYEIIVADDGSSDSTASIVERFAEKESRLRLVRHEANRGIVLARDTLLENSSGQYIVWVDADDYIDCTRLYDIAGLIKSRGVDIVITSYLHDDLKKPKVFHDAIPCGIYEGEAYEKMKPYLFAVDGKSGMRNIHSILWNKAFKRELMMYSFRSISPALLIGDDLPRTYVALLAASSMAILDSPTYHYVQHPSQTMRIRYVPDYFVELIGAYKIISAIATENHLTDMDIRYEVDLGIAVAAITAIVREYKNPSKKDIDKNIRAILDNPDLKLALTDEVLAVPAFFIRKMLLLIKKGKIRLVKALLHCYSLISPVC